MKNLREIRRQIDAIDAEIILLLARRLEHAANTKNFKKNGSIRDPKRELELQKKWLKHCKEHKVSPAFALKVLGLLLKESRRIQSTV